MSNSTSSQVSPVRSDMSTDGARAGVPPNIPVGQHQAMLGQIGYVLHTEHAASLASDLEEMETTRYPSSSTTSADSLGLPTLANSPVLPSGPIPLAVRRLPPLNNEGGSLASPVESKIPKFSDPDSDSYSDSDIQVYEHAGGAPLTPQPRRQAPTTGGAVHTPQLTRRVHATGSGSSIDPQPRQQPAVNSFDSESYLGEPQPDAASSPIVVSSYSAAGAASSPIIEGLRPGLASPRVVQPRTAPPRHAPFATYQQIEQPPVFNAPRPHRDSSASELILKATSSDQQLPTHVSQTGGAPLLTSTTGDIFVEHPQPGRRVSLENPDAAGSQPSPEENRVTEDHLRLAQSTIDNITSPPAHRAFQEPQHLPGPSAGLSSRTYYQKPAPAQAPSPGPTPAGIPQRTCADSLSRHTRFAVQHQQQITSRFGDRNSASNSNFSGPGTSFAQQQQRTFHISQGNRVNTAGSSFSGAGQSQSGYRQQQPANQVTTSGTNIAAAGIRQQSNPQQQQYAQRPQYAQYQQSAQQHPSQIVNAGGHIPGAGYHLQQHLPQQQPGQTVGTGSIITGAGHPQQHGNQIATSGPAFSGAGNRQQQQTGPIAPAQTKFHRVGNPQPYPRPSTFAGSQIVPAHTHNTHTTQQQQPQVSSFAVNSFSHPLLGNLFATMPQQFSHRQMSAPVSSLTYEQLIAVTVQEFKKNGSSKLNAQPHSFMLRDGPASETLTYLTQNFTLRPPMDVAFRPQYEPFVERALERHKLCPAVLKIEDLPYEVKASDIIAFIGGTAKILNDNEEPVHIMQERLTSKTGAAYIEFYDAHSALKVVEKYETARGSNKPLRLHNRAVTVSLGSHDGLMKDLFPNARGVTWANGEPIITDGSRFKGFVSDEELVCLVKNVEVPSRFPYSRGCPQRPVETMISILKKFPWYKTHLIKVKQRWRLFQAVLDMIHALAETMNKLEFRADVRGDQLAKKSLEVLNDKLIRRLITAGMNCQGFTVVQRDEIAFIARLDAQKIKSYHIPWCADGWKHMYALSPNPTCPVDVVDYYIALIREETTRMVESLPLWLRQHVRAHGSTRDLYWGYFYFLACYPYGPDFDNMTLQHCAMIEMGSIEWIMRKVLPERDHAAIGSPWPQPGSMLALPPAPVRPPLALN